ncbi:flagellar hook-length control protein FliK [Saccharospirillum sp. HFRX-1]|uniref:flagellar hook-length control protein FliK n=1 Tax=unclassified Saccharospirillum TaxID=2633430 RepID=UPI003719BA92
MLFLTSPDASLKPVSLSPGTTPDALKVSSDGASDGVFARLLSTATAPRPLSTDAEQTPVLTPQLLKAALGNALGDGVEGQNLPLQRQALVGMLPDGVVAQGVLPGTTMTLNSSVLPSLDLPVSDEEGGLNLKSEGLPSTSWLARLFGLGPTTEEAGEALDDLDSSLQDLGETIAQLLGVKPLRELVEQNQSAVEGEAGSNSDADLNSEASDGGEIPVEGALALDGDDFDVEAALAQLGIDLPSETVEQWITADTLVIDPKAVERLQNFLHEELGLNLVQTETVINAMTTWVKNPPQLNITPEQLAAADGEQWQQVEQLTQVLDELGGQFSSWLEQLNAMANGSDNDAIADAAPVLSKELRTLADALNGKGNLESDGKTPSPAVMVARLLQSVQNSATSGSLPITLDNSRPEQALLLAPASPVSHDVAFNTTLVKMARESLASKTDAETRVAALSSAVSASGDSSQVVNLSLSQSDTPEQPQVLDLKRVDRPLVSAEVSRQLSERIQMMSQGEIKHATIRLDPPELGTLEIKVTVQHDQTQVQITSPNPQVREALESQSVRLREILEQQGLNLSNLDVRDQSSNGNADSGDGSGNRRGGGEGDDGLDQEVPLAAASSRPMGLVDHFV